MRRVWDVTAGDWAGSAVLRAIDGRVVLVREVAPAELIDLIHSGGLTPRDGASSEPPTSLLGPPPPQVRAPRPDWLRVV